MVGRFFTVFGAGVEIMKRVYEKPVLNKREKLSAVAAGAPSSRVT